MPPYEQPAFKKENLKSIMPIGVHIPNYGNMYLPNAEDFCAKEITIPHQVLLSEKEGVLLMRAR